MMPSSSPDDGGVAQQKVGALSWELV